MNCGALSSAGMIPSHSKHPCASAHPVTFQRFLRSVSRQNHALGADWPSFLVAPQRLPSANAERRASLRLLSTTSTKNKTTAFASTPQRSATVGMADTTMEDDEQTIEMLRQQVRQLGRVDERGGLVGSRSLRSTLEMAGDEEK